MHITLKWTFFFLGCAIATGALIASDFPPLVAETAEGLCLISVVLAMFFAVAYSLRVAESKT